MKNDFRRRWFGASCNFFPQQERFGPAIVAHQSNGLHPLAAERGAIVNLHPLQLACATLAIVFTLGLFGATQWLRQQQLNSQQPRLALQLAATPL
jgi:hypothetical protein